MVLKVPAGVVDELVKHGKQPTKHGTGAFPQIAGHQEGKPGSVCLAISSFLLTRSDNNDGYDEVMHEFWGSPKGLLDPAATRDQARKQSLAWFSIIDAVKDRANTVKDHPPHEMLIKPERKDVQGTKEILRLLQDYLKIFTEQTFPNENSILNKKNFQEWLGTDEPISQWPAIQQARNNVREFLRKLPAVASYSNVAAHPDKGSTWKAESRKAWTDAQEELIALQKSLFNKDDLRSSEGDAWMFGLAARGIPGWGDLPALT